MSIFDDRAQLTLQRQFHARIKGAVLAVILVFTLIVLRCYYLQIIRGAFYRELSENNRLALVKTRAPRGIIFDRNRQVLAANRPSFRVTLVLEDVKELQRTTDMLVQALELDADELGRSIKRVGRYRRFEPLVVKEDVSRDRLAYLEALKYQYPGVNLEVESRRSYPGDDLAAHLLGYVGEVGPQELEQKHGVGYDPGDFVGKTGLEKEFDEFLKGIDGGLQVEVDSLGRRLQVINTQEPLPGYDLMLTIDRDVQRVAETALGDLRGAVVVMDPGNGEVLALASRPAYNPNLFSVGISAQDWGALLKDEYHPLQNRALQSHYPPGSVYKLIIAAAGLSEGLIDEQTTFFCGGGIQFGDRYFRCWKKGGHGTINLHRAIVESCDAYFYQLGLKVGIDTIARYARELGLGQRTGIGLPGEWPGLVPDSAWKRKTRGEAWYPGETLSASIGQGYNLLTPLQMAVMVSAVANDGTVYRPRLVKAVLAPEGKILEEYRPEEVRRAKVTPAVLAAIRRGMWGVVNEPGGTGGLARLKEVEVAGKTGTAQVVKMRQPGEEGSQAYLPEKHRDHAWFACFAPLSQPRAVVVVMVEHGGHGGTVSAPIARKVLQAIFEKEQPPGAPAAGGAALIAAPEQPAPPTEDEEGD